MDLENYINKKKRISCLLLDFIDCEAESEINNKFQNLIESIEIIKNANDDDEIFEFLQLISIIANHHHRIVDFFKKIGMILLYMSDYIKQKFSNHEIFYIFKYNKRVLLILIENNILSIDDNMINSFIEEEKNIKIQSFLRPEIRYKYDSLLLNESDEEEEDDEKDDDEKEEDEEEDDDDYQIKRRFKKDNIKKKKELNPYFHYIYFYPEIKNLIDEKMKKIIRKKILEYDKKIFTNFEEKRKKGENEYYICELIRKDLIDDFIIYVNKENLSLNSTTIKKSVFESNYFLIDKEPTLIEYAAFYGSKQIFQYLRFNQVELNPILWLYAIHGNNADIIHFLEENVVDPPNGNYNDCFKEAIKCHHNDIANYFIENYMNINDIFSNDSEINENINISFQYFNFFFYPSDIKNLFQIMLDSALRVSAFSNHHKSIQLFLSQKETQIMANDFQLTPIRKILIPSTVTNIEDKAFYGCCFLEKIIFETPSFITSINYFSFAYNSISEITIVPSVKRINDSAFYQCKLLKQVIFKNPSSLIHIGRCAFHGCLSLTEITIPSTVKCIDCYAFFICPSLKKVTFEMNSSLNSLNRCAFDGCSSLTDILLPSSLKNIGSGAFAKCSSLSRFSIPSSVDRIKLATFADCKSLVEIDIPSSVVSIEKYAFYRCKSLKKISIPKLVLSIQKFAFYQCSSLSEITIPDLLQTIEANSFRKCSSLSQVLIPSKVLTDSNAFSKNTKIIPI